ncbi:hypothetical protein C8R43DRAFT_1112018 [Mycena crocata]|nr:hypothetical protein C8R43DRAFT_1112018 [Mycena crocata]
MPHTPRSLSRTSVVGRAWRPPWKGLVFLREKEIKHSYGDDPAHTHVYYEFWGSGEPPQDVGRPGDIYLDVTFPPIVYYVRDTAYDWQPWNREASNGSQLLAQHPNYADKYLYFVTGKVSGLCWLTKSTLKGRGIEVTNQLSMDAKFQNQISKIMSRPKDQDALDREQQSRRQLEIERRRVCGIPVFDDQPPAHLRPFDDKLEEPNNKSKSMEQLAAENDCLHERVEVFMAEIQAMGREKDELRRQLEQANGEKYELHRQFEQAKRDLLKRGRSDNNEEEPQAKRQAAGPLSNSGDDNM